MKFDAVHWYLFLAACVISALFLAIRRRKKRLQDEVRARQPVSGGTALRTGLDTTPFDIATPDAIVLGVSAEKPGVRIAPFANETDFKNAKTISDNIAVLNRLSAGLQAVPSLLIAESHRGKTMMEVVINGDLVRSMDGASLRAWAVNSQSQITEHAKLIDAKNLQNMVNVAAIWQVASVVVAQKHLADISEKLDDIRHQLDEVKKFQDEERLSKIAGTYDYLKLVALTLSRGEFSAALRSELESSERELLQIQHHLQFELGRRSSESVEHSEFAGTGDLERDTLAKYVKLQKLAKDVHLILKTRALAWHVLSLFPGEPILKEARLNEFLHSAKEIEDRLDAIISNAETDSQKFKSFWNNGETLARRKQNVTLSAQCLVDDLRLATASGKDSIVSSNALLLEYDKPTYLLFEVENGRIGEVRMMDRAS